MNLTPPILRPDLPTYPQVMQNCRVYGSPLIAGTSVYAAFVQQYTGTLSMRDREACYVWEPNGVSLNGRIYECRLIGSYLGLPLFSYTCPSCGGTTVSSAGPIPTSSGNPNVGSGTAGCTMWTYGDCTNSGTIGPFAWSGSCTHATNKKLYAVFTSGPTQLTNLGYFPLCYDFSTGGWDAVPNAAFSLCGQAIIAPTSLVHFFYPGLITSNVITNGNVPGLLSVIQCNPLIMQGTFTTICGGSAVLTIMEDVPSQPYCGGATSSSAASSQAPSQTPSQAPSQAPANIAITGLGNDSQAATTTLTKSLNLTGQLLVIDIAVFGSLGAATVSSVTFNGSSMSLSLAKTVTPAGIAYQWSQWTQAGLATGNHNLVITVSDTALILMIARQVTGLATNSADQGQTASGLASTPNTGATAISTVANEAVLASFMLFNHTGSVTWAGTPTFIDGGQDTSGIVGLTGVVLTEGRYIASAVQTFTAALSGITPAGWSGGVASYQ